MKNLKRFLVLFFMINLTLTGCYTIVWDPTEEISYTPGNNDESGFYENVHYGNFSDFYDTPWWISSPVFIGTYNGSGTKTKDRTNNRNDETNSFRNDGGRGNNERNPGFNNGNSGTTINTPPPTRNVGSENTSETQNPNSTRNSNSSSNNGTRNSNSGNTKDNSSTRNSGNGRR